MLKSLQCFSNFVEIIVALNEICLDFQRFCTKHCRKNAATVLLEFLDFKLIFIMIIPEIYLIFE